MIEVEKKFQPTGEQLDALLKDAEFLGEKDLHDIYYDYSDYRLLKKGVKFRKRNGDYELKIKISNNTNKEIDNVIEIKKYFEIDLSLEGFIDEKLFSFIEYDTKRKKYKKGDFIIDVDKMSFGYECVEIEIIVENENEVPNANERILNLAKEYNIEIKKVPKKREEYFRLYKPELYKELYGNIEAK